MDNALDKLGAAADEQLKKWIVECNCPMPLLVKTFSTFDKTRQQKAYTLMSSWDWNKDGSVVLYSEGYGVGKTHLCGALVNKILQTEKPAWLIKGYFVQTRSCPVYFATEPQLMDRIRATFNRTQDDAETDEQIYKRLAAYQVVIIDDVGKLKPRDPSFLQGVYFRIMDSRSVYGKPMVLTTNLRLAELEAHIGGACADRLRSASFVDMKGTSYRGLKQKAPVQGEMG